MASLPASLASITLQQWARRRLGKGRDALAGFGRGRTTQIRQGQQHRGYALELITLSLGLPADRFNGHFKEQISFLRFNHYTPCPQPELSLGVSRHKDGGALTVLSQDSVGGLRIQRRSDGEWISIRPTPDAYVINVGNAMQVWTNDLYWSAEHRVLVNTEKERFSVPFFFFPGHHVSVKPLDEITNGENPPKYKEFDWGVFFAMRSRRGYKKQEVENLQIDHFKVSK